MQFNLAAPYGDIERSVNDQIPHAFANRLLQEQVYMHPVEHFLPFSLEGSDAIV